MSARYSAYLRFARRRRRVRRVLVTRAWRVVRATAVDRPAAFIRANIAMYCLRVNFFFLRTIIIPIAVESSAES